MEYSFYDLLKLLGSLAMFLYGMKIMSEGLQKFAGDRLRSVLTAMTTNRVTGVLTGVLITALIQSSSATTVMVVSFVNAGLLSLSQSIGVIMGANIGTTVTAWIISALGFKVDMAAMSLPLLAVGVPLLFSGKSSRKSIGEFIFGFSFLFMGLSLLKANAPDLGKNPEMLSFVQNYTDMGFASVILFVLIGTVLTMIVQASAATMAITLLMCSQGWISFEVGAAMVLGENIGTTITANLAAAVANRTAKRAALSHLVFNVIGVIWMLIVFYPFLKLVAYITVMAEGVSPYISAAAIPVALSTFHSLFNITNTLVMVWFIPQIIKIVTYLIKPDTEESENFRLRYIPSTLVNTSELDIETAKQEIEVFGDRLVKMFGFLNDLDNSKGEEYDKIMARIAKYEDITDNMEIEIAKYLTHISESEISSQGSERISSMLRIIDNLESIGDSIYQLSLMKHNQRENKVILDELLTSKLSTIHDMVKKSLDVMNSNLHTEYSKIDLDTAENMENEINQYRDTLRSEHLEAIKSGYYNYETGTAYSGIYALYEKTADFVINVSEAVNKNKTNE